MSFGAFMEGLQGGVKSGQGIRRERQLDDIYDAATRKLKNEEKADNMARADFGDVGDDSALGDPFGQQLFNWAKGLFKGGDDATTAVPDPGAAALQDKVSDVETIRTGIPQAESAIPYEGAGLIPYADGGTPRDYVTAEERVPKVRGNTAVGRATGAVKDAVRAGVDKVKSAIPREIGVDKLGGAEGKTGLARVGARVKGVAKGAGIGYLAGQAISGAKDAFGASTEDMAGEMGINYAPPDGILGAGYDAAIRAGGTMKRVGDAILGRGGEEEAAPVDPAPAAIPPRGVRPGAPPSAVARKPAAPAAAIPTPGAAPAKQAEAPVMSPDVIKQIPWDKVNVMDLPKFKTQDWVKYRESAARQMVMRGGITTLDAYDKVDQQVIGMQQRGTKALLQEAIMRVQSGDLKGAGNALVAMFQYVPSGTDAVVGTYNGQLVAQFIDEQTGQPVGEPTPVDGKMLGDLWQQYANPAAWAEMAQDRAKLADQEARTGIMQGTLDLAERRHEEVDVPSAQSDADYKALVGEAAMAKSVGGGGEDGLKPNEALAYDKDVRETLGGMAMKTDEDGNPLYPQLADALKNDALIALISQIKRATGQNTEAIIIQALQLSQGK